MKPNPSFHLSKLILGFLLLTKISQAELSSPSPATDSTVISLSGSWRFALDPQDLGEKEMWSQQTLKDEVQLPGSTDQNGKGEPATIASRDYWTRSWSYLGNAWYQKTVTIPEDWKDHRVELFLERCRWKTTCWVDGKKIGSHDSMSAPHLYPLGLLTPGDHILTVSADNRAQQDVGYEKISGGSDHAETCWNGLVGRLELRALPPVNLQSAQIYPSFKEKKLSVKLTTTNDTGKPVQATLQLSAQARGKKDSSITIEKTITLTQSSELLTLTLALPGKIYSWDEFTPNLYDLTITLTPQGGKSVTLKDYFGFRDFAAKGTKLSINGQIIMPRGFMYDSIHPMTGYPGMEIAYWKRIFTICKSYGYNFFRCHSNCPPEAAFIAADEVGFYLEPSLPVWQKVEKMTPDLLGWMRQESESILNAYGNHPSFVMFSQGNENMSAQLPGLWEIVKHLQATDPRRLYTCSSHPTGGPERPDNYFEGASASTGPGKDHGRLRGEMTSNTLADYSQGVSALDRPVLSHEVSLWAMFVDLAEFSKYTGFLKPLYLQEIAKQMEERGVLKQANDFKVASGKFITTLLKAEIESQLRTANIGGFEVGSITDFHGQGVAMLGFLDQFYDSKGVITPEQHREFNGPTVALLRIQNQILTNADSLKATAEIANYSPIPFTKAIADWQLETLEGQKITAGSLPAQDIPAGALTRLGPLSIPLTSITRAQEIQIRLSLRGTEITNHWKLWVYPAAKSTAPQKVLIAKGWNDEAKKALQSGGKVLLDVTQILLPKIEGEAKVEWGNYVKIAAGDRGFCLEPNRFLPVYWAYRKNQVQIGTHGLLCDPHHPALQNFPTQGWSDWQWEELQDRSVNMNLTAAGISTEMQPIVQIIDTFERNNRLGTLLEARVGKGTLMLCSMDITHDLEHRLTARQLRQSLLDYMESDLFQPVATLQEKQLDHLLSTTREAVMAVIPGAKPEKTKQKRINGEVPWSPSADYMMKAPPGFSYTWKNASTTTEDKLPVMWTQAKKGANYLATYKWEPMTLEIQCPPGFTGSLRVFTIDTGTHIRNPNVLDQLMGKGRFTLTYEGGSAGEAWPETLKGKWTTLPITAQESADGKIVLTATRSGSSKVSVCGFALMPD